MKSASNFIDFVNKSPSPFHAVSELSKKLVKNGYEKLSEKQVWNLKSGGKYFVTRNESAMVTFMVGGQYKAGNGFHIIGGHTDSPCLKIKPISNIKSNGYFQVGVECYGGGLFHTWFDRDLGVAGRVMVSTSNGEFESKLVLINKAILRIPTLAIHLDREVNKTFTFNKETHLRPILATSIKAKLEDTDSGHSPVLLNVIAKELNVSVEKIHDFELCLFDTQGGNIGGALDEFIFAPRLDNLCCSWVATEALLTSEENLMQDENVRMVALFDNEEVGSNSLMGAGSNFVQQVMDRITEDQKLIPVAARKSILISADMAHGVHPNYSDKHEMNHRPQMHKGPVIKYNANERYATSGESAFLLKQIAKMVDVDIQEFVVRQDTGCGSTIGPILSTSTGVRTIDVGIAQLSMHSIREMCGTDDLDHTLTWFRGIFAHFSTVDNKLTMDS